MSLSGARLGLVPIAITMVFHPAVSARHSGAPTDACALLTPAQVSAVLGVTVGAGVRVTPTNALICGWAPPNDASRTGKHVVLSIYGQLGPRTPADRFAMAKTPVPGVEKTPVAGVGDDAFYSTAAGLGTGLVFKKGDSAFDLHVYGFPVEEIKAKEKSLAADVLGKI
jgi:hypothetical protein